MLVHHADAAGPRISRIAYQRFLAIQQHFSLVRRIEAHDAFDERGLARAILAEQCMEGAGLDGDGHIVKRDKRPKDLGHPDGLERHSAPSGMSGNTHGMLSIARFEFGIGPNALLIW